MAKILIAWELGHGLGHAMPLRTLAQRLLQRGHQVLLAGRDQLRLRQVFAGTDVRIFAAPFFPGVVLPPQQQSSLADVIWFDAGGHSAEVCSAQLLAWRELIGVLQPDLLVADAAPMALAAAADLLPAILYDSYFHATDARAWGIFRDWERIDSRACEERAQRLLTHLNEARNLAGLKAVAALPEAFPHRRCLLRTLPELDYAGPRDDVRYVGQAATGGAPAQWPQPDQPQRVFAYVRREHPLADRIISALARLQQASVLCFHDGIAADKLRAASHLAYTQTPLDLAALLPQTSAVVCQGGALQALATQYGKPTLALALHTEQYLSGRMAERAGCSIQYLARGDRPDLLPLLRQLLATPAYTERARAIAAAHQLREPDPLHGVITELEAALGG